MIKETVIFGKSAVREFEESDEIPSDKWLEDHGGVIDEKEFNTLAEYKAYAKGLDDAQDWEETVLFDPEFTEDTIADCKHCQQWRAYFSDRESKTYCPDCGKLIIHITEDTLEENG